MPGSQQVLSEHLLMDRLGKRPSPAPHPHHWPGRPPEFPRQGRQILAGLLQGSGEMGGEGQATLWTLALGSRDITDPSPPAPSCWLELASEAWPLPCGSTDPSPGAPGPTPLALRFHYFFFLIAVKIQHKKFTASAILQGQLSGTDHPHGVVWPSPPSVQNLPSPQAEALCPRGLALAAQQGLHGPRPYTCPQNCSTES